MHANGEHASGAAARPAAGPGPVQQKQRPAARPTPTVMILGGIGLPYGALIATGRYGLTPWALLSAHGATVLLAVQVAAELAPLWPQRIPRGISRVARITATAARHPDRGDPAALLAPALAIPSAAFTACGLIHLADAM